MRRALAVLALWSSCLCSQAADTPPIVTKVEEVSLNLVVRTKKGKPVSDLEPGDLRIFENGAPAKIADLRRVTGSSSDRAVTLVFDRLEATAGHQARNAANQLLKLAPASGLSFAVLEVAGRLRLLQEFTSDRQALRAAVGIATGKDKQDPAKESAAAERELFKLSRGSDAPARTMAQVMLTSLEQSERIAQDQHAAAALAGLLALARAQQRLPGRKAIVYFAHGLQLDSRGEEFLKTIASAASRSGVSFYTVDLNGLDLKTNDGLMAAIAMSTLSHNGGSPDITVPGGEVTMMGEQMGRIESNVATHNQGPLGELSAATGGAYVSSEENPRKLFRRMLEDLGSYYELSYVPAKQEDGRFRSIRVQARRQGLAITAPRGYFALPAGEASIRPFEAPLLKVLNAPELPDDVQFRSTVLNFGEMPFGNANSVVIEVPLRDIEFREDPNANLFTAHVSVVAQIRNKAGAVVEHFGADIPRQGALDLEARTHSETVTFRRHFIADPGQYTLEAVVMDRNSGEVGAQRRSFEIPALPPGPAVSDMALVRRTEPLPAEDDPTEPLRYGKRLIVPNLSGYLPREATDLSLFFVIYPDARSSDKPKLDLELRSGGKSLGRVALQMRQASGDEPMAYLASLKSGALPGGRYEAVAILTQGSKTAERALDFTLQGSESPSASIQPTAGPSPKTELPLSPASERESKLLVLAPVQNSAARPSSEELEALLSGAKERASAYADSLPNLICVERTDRSVDPSGLGNWRHKDNIAELLRYHDKLEQRTTLEVNGVASDVSHADLQGTISYGEFGALLNAVFSPGAKAKFQWKETGALSSGTVQVFEYRVARENSTYGITAGNGKHVTTAFHGLVYIDTATRGVRRVTLEADGLPPAFPIHSASIAMDYGYIAISDHDYLLPVAGTVTLREHKRHLVRNEIEFQNYRRYGAESSIRFH